MGGSTLGTIRLRPLAADDHDAVAAVGNATWPEQRVTGAELAARDRRVASSRPVRRVVALQGEAIVGWSLAEGEAPGDYRVSRPSPRRRGAWASARPSPASWPTGSRPPGRGRW
ncbi:MAG: hypothetical protein R3F43_31755 [bacterium]